MYEQWKRIRLFKGHYNDTTLGDRLFEIANDWGIPNPYTEIRDACVPKKSLIYLSHVARDSNRLGSSCNMQLL